jgi:UPF0148 protein
MDEEEKIKKITKLLEQGCTMLAAHHDCGAPLFRCKGEVLCPVCSFGALKYDGKQTGKMGSSPSAKIDETIMHDVTSITNVKDLSAVAVEQNQFRKLRGDERSRQESTDGSFAKPDQELSSSSNDGELGLVKQAVREAVLMRLTELALAIKEEKDLSRLRSQLDCVEVTLRVLSSLKREI